MLVKIFAKPVNSRLINLPDKWDLSSDFQSAFMSFHLKADCLIVVAGSCSCRCYSSCSTSFFMKYSRNLFLVFFSDVFRQFSRPISSNFSNILLRVVLTGKFSQDYPFSTRARQEDFIVVLLYTLVISLTILTIAKT